MNWLTMQAMPYRRVTAAELAWARQAVERMLARVARLIAIGFRL